MDKLKPELILPSKQPWFGLIRAGLKKEEYRELKPYYMSRFKNVFSMSHYSYIPSSTDRHIIMFRNGYSRNSPSFLAECSLDINTVFEEWGAEPGKEYYVLKIHRIITGDGAKEESVCKSTNSSKQ